MIAFGKDDSLREGWVDDKNWMNGPSEILPAEGIPSGSFHGVKMIPAGLDGKGRTGDGGHRSKVTFIWMSGLLIFIYSVVLEVVQFYLPYRTFNVYDVVANACGILLFGIWMLFISHPEAPRSEVSLRPIGAYAPVGGQRTEAAPDK